METSRKKAAISLVRKEPRRFVILESIDMDGLGVAGELTDSSLVSLARGETRGESSRKCCVHLLKTRLKFSTMILAANGAALMQPFLPLAQ